MLHTVIIGTGDMAYGLCHLFKNHNYDPKDYTLHVSKPGLSTPYIKSHRNFFHDTGVELINMNEALQYANIVIFAIPSSALKQVINGYYSMLKDKILVDITNSSVPGEDLHSMLDLVPNSRWVKGLNDVGAVDILLDKPSNKKPLTTILCGNNIRAVQTVKKFAQEALGFGFVKIVPHSRYHDISMNQTSMSKDYVHAAYIMIFLFVLTEVYAIMRYNVWKGYEWYHLPLQVTNKAICWTSLTGFAFCMMPGLMARYFDSIHNNKMLDKPQWIRYGLSIRKPLGLLALWFLVLHILISLLLFNSQYYGKFFIDPTVSSKLNKTGEVTFFFGILGAALYTILGVCSLPSIAMQMTNKSWQVRKKVVSSFSYQKNVLSSNFH